MYSSDRNIGFGLASVAGRLAAMGAPFSSYIVSHLDTYSESKYSVVSVSGKYLKNGWSDQHGDFSVEFIKLMKNWQLYFLHLMTF